MISTFENFFERTFLLATLLVNIFFFHFSLEIKFAKSLQEYKALFEEYAENDPDPMEEVIAQELERLKKKEEKERLEWEKKQIS